MNISLPEPPSTIEQIIDLPRWLGNLWRYVRPSASTSGDAAATIPSGSTYHGVTALTAARTLTMPASANYRDGESVVVQDESGAAGTHNITIQRAGSDTINGGTSVSITANYGRRTLIKRGPGAFFSA